MHSLSILIKKTKTFFSLGNKKKFEFLQTFIYTGIMRAYILFVPFNKLRKKMGKVKEESAAEESIEVYREVSKVRQIVRVVASHTPWESKCLVQALTAQKMLNKKEISTTLYLGVKKDGNEMKAHAWLRCGEYYVTGGEIRDQYTVVAKFAS